MLQLKQREGWSQGPGQGQGISEARISSGAPIFCPLNPGGALCKKEHAQRGTEPARSPEPVPGEYFTWSSADVGGT